MSIHREKHDVVISGGAGSFVTDHPWRGALWQLIAEPTSTDTTYDLVINNRVGDDIITFTDQVGELNAALEMPVLGTYTFIFSNVTADEPISVRTFCRDTINY